MKEIVYDYQTGLYYIPDTVKETNDQELLKELFEYRKQNFQNFMYPQIDKKYLHTTDYNNKLTSPKSLKYSFEIKPYDINEINSSLMKNENIDLYNIFNKQETEDVYIVEETLHNISDDIYWVPEIGESFYWIAGTGEVVKTICCGKEGCNKKRWDFGNCYKTEEEALFVLEKMKVKRELQHLANLYNDEKIDWTNKDQPKYYIVCENGILEPAVVYNTKLNNDTVYFSRAKFIDQAIKKIGPEKLKKYLFEYNF